MLAGNFRNANRIVGFNSLGSINKFMYKFSKKSLLIINDYANENEHKRGKQ